MIETIGKDNGFSPPFDEDILTSEDITEEIEKQAKEAEAQKIGNIITGEYLINRKVESIPCLLWPFFQTVGLVSLAGSSDTGKSTILRQFAIAVVMGWTHFMGWTLNAKHKSAIIVSTEDDPSAISFLLSRQAKGIDAANLKNLRFLFEYENLIKELDAALTEQKADLVIIDCFADVYGGDLKDTSKIRAFLNQFQVLALKYECLFLFLHHTGKRSENFEPSKNNLLSGQGFEGKMRCVIELRADPTRADHRHWCIVKGNYLAADHKSESYVLEFNPETFMFSNTDDRMPNELLAKSTNDGGRAKHEKAKALRDSGKTLEQIAVIMGYKTRGAVSKLLDRTFD